MSYIRSYAEILDQIDAVDPVAYARTRNHLGGAVTRLSPYISRGVVSLPEVRERLLSRHRAADCEKLIQELTWREYFQRVWWEKGDAIFSELRFPRSDWQHTELVSVLVNADTGIEVIDEGVKELYDTGYMHNHLRMWVAGMACNVAGAHWYDMGRWLYAHLVDGDLASNFLSWQWVAGTSVNKQYTFDQALINACSDSMQTKTMLSRRRDDMLSQTVPPSLQIHEPFTIVTEYPENDVDTISQPIVHLYTPWTLQAGWRKDEQAERILIIDPVWFDRFPVSELVLDFILRQGKTVIPNLQVFVGQPHELGGIDTAEMVRTIAHQTNRDWLVQFDEPAWLFSEVSGYYQSFYKYWQAVTETYSRRM